MPRKEDYQKYREQTIAYNTEWRKRNKDKVRAYRLKWYKNNLDRVLELARNYRKRSLKVRLTKNLASAICHTLQGAKQGRKWEGLVGYTLEDLIKHLETQFNDKMNWTNYGNYWEIDHIKPISSFGYIVPEDKEFKLCWALSNLRPLSKY